MAKSQEYFAASSELEAVGSNSDTPSPAGSVFATPRVSMSRRPSSRRETLRSRGGSSSPPPMPSSSPPPASANAGGDAGNDDDILLDPRRFTPTLHASLVSEILNVRRELDSKHKFIEDLETGLQQSKEEKDELQEKLIQSDKERRSLKRQFQQLENGTLSALEELAKDRDSAKASAADLKTKFEEAQAKIRRKEEESDRTHAAWEKEKNAWDTERRAFERRVHITETRLKHVLSELEAAHQAHHQMQEGHISGDEDTAKDSGLGDESDTNSQASPQRNSSHRRTMSNSSRRSFNRYRFSVQSIPGTDMHKTNGISLADELQLDEEDEEELDGSDVEVGSPDASRKGALSRASINPDEKAKRILGLTEHRRTLEAPIEFDSPTNTSSARNSAFDALEAYALGKVPAPQYVDTGVQYTPPSSPALAAKDSPKSAYTDAGVQYEPVPEFADLNRVEDESTAQPLRNTMQTPPLLVDRAQQMSPVPSPKKSQSSMVSSSSQTVEEPLSPPATPGVSPPSSPTEPMLPVSIPVPQVEQVDMSTQTDFVEPKTVPATPTRAAPPHPLTIPSINIIPPTSAPTSPTSREAKLPPHTKNAGCQTFFESLVETSDASVQTEEIRMDKRLLAKLPPHLHPDNISSNPGTPELAKSRLSQKKRSPLSNIFSERSVLRSPSPIADDIPSSPPTQSPTKRTYADVWADSEKGESSRRRARGAALGSAFETDRDRAESDDTFDEPEPKVANFSTPSMAGRTMKHLRSFASSRPSPVPEEKEVEDKDMPSDRLPKDEPMQPASQSVASGRSSFDTAASDKGKRAMSVKSTGSKQQSIRRSAMIQSGTVAHIHRSRTPSVASVSSSFYSNRSVGPPFPVPDRGSSRKMFSSRSEGSQSPTPRTNSLFGTRRRQGVPLVRKDSLRKVRSATTIQRSNSRGRNRSRSPPLEPALPITPGFNPPPMPKDEVPMPAKVYPSQRSGEKRLSARPLSPSKQPELTRASQGTVVDAIASAMVGEWMWKYVRRRTSFGVPESPQEQIGRPGTDGSVNVTGNGVRHKRWVWLSPYERAIMWSSKQPASNSALMGKSGRKLVIQSVLDVRDDTPLPKNHGISEPFNRSILILTPARALKFTATSRERHYTWLTALSFLAHSPMLSPDLAGLPHPGAHLESAKDARSDPPSRGKGGAGSSASSGTGLKRGAIRDSVRLAKDRRPAPRAKDAGSIPEIEFSAAFGPSAATPLPPLPSMPAAPAAEAPNVPRFTSHHGRKRSLTGPRLPSSALRGLGYRDVPSPSFPMVVPNGMPSPGLDLASGRTSEASSATRTTFLDAVGTIRMEAFIEGQTSAFGGIGPPVHVPSGYSPSGSGGAAPVPIVGRRRGNTAFSSSDGGSDGRRSGMVIGDDFEIPGGSLAWDPFSEPGRYH